MTKLTNNHLAFAWREADNYADQDAYVSDMALSSVFADGPEAPVDMDLAAQLRRVWDAYHMTIAAMRATTGLSQRQFGDSLLIPYRTVQNWENRQCCPEYTRLMIARCVGLI